MFHIDCFSVFTTCILELKHDFKPHLFVSSPYCFEIMLLQEYEDEEEDEDDEDDEDTGMGDEGEDSNEGTGSADGTEGYEADGAEVKKKV